RRQELERDRLAELEVVGAVYLAHAAASQEAHDAVAARDHRAGKEARRLRRGARGASPQVGGAAHRGRGGRRGDPLAAGRAETARFEERLTASGAGARGGHRGSLTPRVSSPATNPPGSDARPKPTLASIPPSSRNRPRGRGSRGRPTGDRRARGRAWREAAS